MARHISKFFRKAKGLIMGHSNNVGGSATIRINGQTFTGQDANIVGGKLIIDGVEQVGALPENILKIEIVSGVLRQLNTDLSVTCGDIAESVNCGGSVNCGDVGGNVDASGSCNAKNVGGSVKAGGSVTCKKVSGSVKAGGNIVSR
jgi:hypothetical protein